MHGDYERRRRRVEDELEELARRVSEGHMEDVDRLALVLRQFIQPYVAKALRGLPHASADDREDLTQDVWLECFRMAGQFRPERGRAAAYFGRVAFQAASYKSRGLRQRAQVWAPLPAVEDEAGPLAAALPDPLGIDPETVVVVQEAVRDILQLMSENLPRDLVRDIALGDFRDAERLGLLPAERAHAVHLARRRLRRLLRKRWPDLPLSLRRETGGPSFETDSVPLRAGRQEKR
ncbi:MAG: hypothetical protein K6V97_09475 [Actinomycetia bacterium]|nr:hypothetical protein [Actinomycetes bacterium]